MTREDAINMLYGIQADNLNLDDAYTKDKYDALTMAIKALEQEPCDDAISREAVINAIENDCMRGGLGSCFACYNDAQAFRGEIEKLPSVTQKSGKWIEKEGWDGDVYYECSVCGEPFCLIEGTPTDNMYNYCPNCGARMVEPQERSDEE